MKPIPALSIAEALAQSPLFAGVDIAEIEALAQSCKLQTFAKRETLFLQGDPADRFYLVLKGQIKVYRPDPKGHRQVALQIDQPGNPVAVLALFLPEKRFPASAEAMEVSQTIVVPAEAFLKLVQQYPIVCGNLVVVTAERTGQLVHLLDQLVFREVDSRLAEYLLNTLQRKGQGFKLPTNSELAALMGTTSEPISRKLGFFAQQGWLELHRRTVHILDAQALQRLCCEK